MKRQHQRVANSAASEIITNFLTAKKSTLRPNSHKTEFPCAENNDRRIKSPKNIKTIGNTATSVTHY
jgi:hypothetical protein